jgi:hypothetical protein
MRIADSLKCRLIIYLAAGIALALSLSFPTQMHAQAGYNAVCTATAVSNISCSLTALDASSFTGSTICQKIYSALSFLSTLNSPHPDPGAVIDARNITSPSLLTCSTAGETPWTSGTNAVTTPAIILLPAGLITISTGWIIPDRTRVFGEGERSNPAATYGPGTQIMAGSSFSGTMISLGGANAYPGSSPAAYPCGGSGGICFGVSIANLMINANFQTITGIANTSSQELSYVDHVNLYGILGTGLSITTAQAQNSGPYSNIACNPGPTGTSYTTSTTCVDINGTGDLRGVHGLTATVGSDGCTATTCPTAAIYLDANNTTIEDVHFEGFAAGILVGANASAKGDVIFNANGGGSSLTGPTYNVVEISNATTSGNPNVSDLSIMGVSVGANPSGYSAPNSIDDVLTSATLGDSHLALYALGDPIGTNGYSRFTTSASGVVPTWGVGGSAPSGAAGSCKVGSLYTNTAGSTGTTLYICRSTGWVGID